MNFQNLIDLVESQEPPTSLALYFAKTAVTEELAQSSYQQTHDAVAALQQYQSFVAKVLSIAALGATAAMLWQVDILVFAVMASLILVLFILLGWAVIRKIVSQRLVLAQESLELLAPITDSPVCLEVKHLLGAGEPSVKAWRDLVLQNRNVLRMFDVHMLRALHASSKKLKDRQAQEQACREVHGIVLGKAVSN